MGPSADVSLGFMSRQYRRCDKELRLDTNPGSIASPPDYLTLQLPAVARSCDNARLLQGCLPIEVDRARPTVATVQLRWPVHDGELRNRKILLVSKSCEKI